MAVDNAHVADEVPYDLIPFPSTSSQQAPLSAEMPSDEISETIDEALLNPIPLSPRPGYDQVLWWGLLLPLSMAWRYELRKKLADLEHEDIFMGRKSTRRSSSIQSNDCACKLVKREVPLLLPDHQTGRAGRTADQREAGALRASDLAVPLTRRAEPAVRVEITCLLDIDPSTHVRVTSLSASGFKAARANSSFIATLACVCLCNLVGLDWRVNIALCSRPRNALASDTLPGEDPLEFSERDAIRKLCLPASLNSLGQNLLGSIAATWFPNFGFKMFEPKRIVATYLPRWIIDAEIEAKVWVQKGDEAAAQRTVTAYSSNSIIPGHSFDPLSRFSFDSPSYLKLPSVPFSDDLRTQHGSDVLCMPFTFTPFPLIELAQSLSYQQATISPSFRFDPLSVKPNLFAAYPILIPVYILQYEIDPPTAGDPMSLTAVIEAYEDRSRMIIENVQRQLVQGLFDDITPHKPPSTIVKLADMLPTGFSAIGPRSNTLARFAHITSVIGSPHLDRNELVRWIDTAASKMNAWEKYQSRFFGGKTESQGIDWDDLRIREFTREERTQNRTWMESNSDLAMLKELMSRTMDGAALTWRMQIGHPPSDPADAAKEGSQDKGAEKDLSKDDVQKLMEKPIMLKERQREEQRPAWWRSGRRSRQVRRGRKRRRKRKVNKCVDQFEAVIHG
ncbi:hypothetical protein A0H81_07580 [Grifola frondosa]|uniref:Uncharacterized protein n=1 Tax=Grifola frondosa TaxID=5627 RepID=A0A1C7M662_GRIFR|nr:hypothetical protein A0H81_07580 [Grifola frondosa]